jgi:hypothetical protein
MMTIMMVVGMRVPGFVITGFVITGFMSIGFAHRKFRGGDTGAQHLRRRHGCPVDRKTAQGRAEVIERKPGIQQRPQYHVA